MITPTCPRAGAPRFVRAPHSSTCRALSAGRGPRAACHPSDLLAPHALSLLVVTALRLAWGAAPLSESICLRSRSGCHVPQLSGLVCPAMATGLGPGVGTEPKPVRSKLSPELLSSCQEERAPCTGAARRQDGAGRGPRAAREGLLGSGANRAERRAGGTQTHPEDPDGAGGGGSIAARPGSSGSSQPRRQGTPSPGHALACTTPPSS